MKATECISRYRPKLQRGLRIFNFGQYVSFGQISPRYQDAGLNELLMGSAQACEGFSATSAYNFSASKYRPALAACSCIHLNEFHQSRPPFGGTPPPMSECTPGNHNSRTSWPGAGRNKFWRKNA